MIERIYYWLHAAASRPEEKGEYSAGNWHDMIRQNALEMCSNQSGRFLEVGCGEGLFLAKAVKKFPDVEFWGVDGWSEILSAAKKRILPIRSGVTLLNADASALPLEDAFFDTVVCINVFFNMESIEKVMSSLNEIARVCKTGGRVIFDFRNSLNPFMLLKYKLARYYDLTTRDLHLNTYSPKKMKSVTGQSDLEIVQERALYFPVKALAPIIMVEAVKK
jgi:ubiquinone/menaquinone biosynthesis C-methylase UbiE